jgi:general secretion pathway protein K
MPDTTDVFIAIDNETGKVDLNTANRELLVRLFAALSRDAKVGQRIADSLMRRRPAAPSQAAPLPSPSAGNGSGLGVLVSTLQLDQVAEMPPALFRAALPFVTVKSGRPDLQLDAASPRLRRLLGLLEQSNAAAAQVAAAGNPSFTIRADAATADGARFIREALVSFTGDATRPYIIHEWRHGDVDDASEPIHSSKRARDCFRMREADPKVVRYWN